VAADGKYVRADFTYDKERPSAGVLELEKGFLAGRRHYVAAAVVGCMAMLRPARLAPIAMPGSKDIMRRPKSIVPVTFLG
jgi:hypothetical protein